MLAVVVLAVGEPIDASFALVMVINSVIGVVQEVRAKRTLDSIQVLLTPVVTVMRAGQRIGLAPEELVVDDIFLLEAGDQIPVDATVIRSGGLEADESALTGESLPVAKDEGDELLSGSHVVAGGATAVATRVGAESWAHRLTSEARTFAVTRSELRVGIDRLLRYVSWMLVPLGALLVWSQLRIEGTSVPQGLVAAVAGVEALVPQGLVLLVSMSMAVAVLRLAGRKVVVQELPAVEGLARIDTLCLDKTGTLTTGELVVDQITPLGPAPGDRPAATDGALAASPAGALAGALTAFLTVPALRSSTLDALAPTLDRTDTGPGWGEPAVAVAFSSERKWSAAAFDGHGTWAVGAPEILLDAMAGTGNVDEVRRRVDDLTGTGRRVLLVARSDDAGGPTDLAREALPVGLAPAGLVALKEELRPDAAATLDYFRRQGVEVKVISGDNPRTVAAVVTDLGLEAEGRTADLRTVTDDAALAAVPADTVVFGRVRPEQKRDLVRLLQAQGRTVAMTGDGVNDIPSLKVADIGIAMDTATPATRAVAQLVLLDGRFDRLPGVVGEGRRVIANMERVSSLFVTKTVYAALFALVVGVTGVPFPFLPRHLSLIAALTIGVPGFVLSFRSSDAPSRPGYLRRVLRFSIPAGVTAAACTLAAYTLVRTPVGGDVDLDDARSAATVTLTTFGLWILYRLTRPLDRVEAALLAALAAGFVAVLVPSPVSRLYRLALPVPRAAVVIVVVTVVAALALVLVGRCFGPGSGRARDDGPCRRDAGGARVSANLQPPAEDSHPKTATRRQPPEDSKAGRPVTTDSGSRTADGHGLDVPVRADRAEPAVVAQPVPTTGGPAGETPPTGPVPVVARQGVVSDAAVAYARQKVTHLLGTVDRPVLQARVKLSHTLNPSNERSHQAAVTVDLDGTVVRAHAAASTMPEAVDAALDRLRSNLARLVDRRRDHHPRHPHGPHDHQAGARRGLPPAPWHDRDPGDREVVRHKTFAPDRLSLDDALWDLGLLDYDFFLFTEADTGEDCVVARADDGGFVLHGLAGRPEAVAALARPDVHVSDRPVPVLATSEAVRLLDGDGRPFELYENVFTGVRNVIYHRYDGHYGVITPPRDEPPSEERLVHEGQ